MYELSGFGGCRLEVWRYRVMVVGMVVKVMCVYHVEGMVVGGWLLVVEVTSSG